MSWEVYFEKNKNRPLRPLYLKAIELFESSSKVAIDLGCGVGTEVSDLLRRGFTVHAIDQESKAIELVKAENHQYSDRLHAKISSFENLNIWPSVDFLYAFHSLPFCQETRFDDLIQKTICMIKPQGLYVASFFGLEDDWVVDNRVNGIGLEKLRAFFDEFELLQIEETKRAGNTVVNGEKLWHVVEIIARKL